ncbi:electron transport complex subunit RsxC [Clostridium sp. Sa3CUN1]|uniref:Ion-translocating oxidoreductase complex subunit C n=1 Tax=Clostridium gallinarum TaxID=2762246 RepID=A0ABR8Q4R6_9CLOT|nr:electron transport complex subunit RsxC [Clostridium gallinarum]MBD7915390.1 electron transport complex subunit RsxC [Clostridium gallinarum]
MKLGTFKGGVHPRDGKDISKNTPIKEILPKGYLVYPMSQHIGAPAKPIVAIGDKVLAGQKIGEATGFISANIVSSVSGVVKAVEPRLTVSGNKVTSIVIENDNEYKELDGIGERRDYTKLSKEEIRNYVKEAGIVGLGGAGFPNHVKLTPKDDNAIDYVIVNAVECEPYLTSDYRVMLEMPEKIVGGLKVVLSLFKNAKGIIAVEDNKPDAIKILRKAVEGENNISISVLKTKYPQGSERKLIFATTGRKINSSMLPADAGCVVDNVDTIVAIYMAVCESTPLMRKIITVTGDAIKEPRNFEVKIGTSYSQLVEEAGGFKERPEKIISGGPMMGTAIFSLDIPVTKTSSALLAFTKDEVAENEPTACIRCGRCVEVCPSSLIPQKIIENVDGLDNESFIALNGMECYECGSCTYICPAKRRLTQAFKQSRKSVLDSRRKK